MTPNAKLTWSQRDDHRRHENERPVPKREGRRMLTVHLKEDNPLPEGLVEEMHKAAHEESNRDWRDWLRGARWAIRRLLEDRKDAARYRWLQEHTAATGLSRWMGSEQFLSEAVDKAIANSKTPNAAITGCRRQSGA